MPSIKQLEDQGRVLLTQQKSLVEDTTRPWSEKRDEYDRIEADVKSILEQHTALKSVNRDPFGENRDEAATAPKPEGPSPSARRSPRPRASSRSSAPTSRAPSSPPAPSRSTPRPP
jgi:hypothetical protein